MKINCVDFLFRIPVEKFLPAFMFIFYAGTARTQTSPTHQLELISGQTITIYDPANSNNGNNNNYAPQPNYHAEFKDAMTEHGNKLNNKGIIYIQKKKYMAELKLQKEKLKSLELM